MELILLKNLYYFLLMVRAFIGSFVAFLNGKWLFEDMSIALIVACVFQGWNNRPGERRSAHPALQASSIPSRLGCCFSYLIWEGKHFFPLTTPHFFCLPDPFPPSSRSFCYCLPCVCGDNILFDACSVRVDALSVSALHRNLAAAITITILKISLIFKIDFCVTAILKVNKY